MKNCPNCNSNDLKHCYVYIQCNKCLMTGPQMNGGKNDQHADYMDSKAAEEAWDNLPRRS